MIIGIGGRIKSGKTELSLELIKKGFIKISFADYLKSAVAYLYDFDVNLLKTELGKNEVLSSPLIWNKKVSEKLFDYLQIYFYEDAIEEKSFSTRRECLQYIGTDLLRSYDIDFHVKNTLKTLDLTKNYVCDDVRFYNEFLGLKKLNAHMFYVIRPNNFDIMNHASETSLNWSIFQNHIINNKSIGNLKLDFLKAIKNIDYILNEGNSIITRDLLTSSLLQNNYNTYAVAKQLNCNRDKTIWLSQKYAIDLPYNKFYCNIDSFLKPSEEAAYYAGVLSANGCIKKSGKYYVVELSSPNIKLVQGFKDFIKSDKPICSVKDKNNKINYILTIRCPYIIENLKYWNIKPREQKVNELPDIIKNDLNLIHHWHLGLLEV
jgi:hypothetical protein